VMFLSIMGTRVPAEKRPGMAELLTRINHNLMFGNFEMDFADGEIRCRTSVDVAGGELASEMLETLIHANLQSVDRFHPAIGSLLWNDLSPEEALAMIEGQT